MKLSTILSAVLVALSPVGAAITGASINRDGPSDFTFNLPNTPGFPAPATITIHLAGINQTTITNGVNATGQAPSAAVMATIHAEVHAFTNSFDDDCNNLDCCLQICMTIIWIPIVGFICIAECESKYP